MSFLRIRAVALKEFRELRRTRTIVVTMAVLPVVFLIAPALTIFKIPASAPASLADHVVGVTSLLLLMVPAVIPPTIAAYSVLGERDQGTLEPCLTTPVRSAELLLGKALAAFVPSVVVAYVLYAIVLAGVRAFAVHVVSAVLWSGPQMLAQILFTPLLAAWAIWVGIAISTRARDVRSAQQLSTLASLPLLGFTSLVTFQVISPSVSIAVVAALILLVIDLAAWRVVSGLFNRERLITGASDRPSRPAPG